MKKGIIAISLLLAGAMLIGPISNVVAEEEVKVEQVIEAEDKTTQINDIDETTENKNETTENKDEISKSEEEVKEEQVIEAEDETIQINDIDETTENKNGMSKLEAEEVLNKYIEEVEGGGFTYTYQGDEDDFEAIKEKGIRGYVFLPDVDTDLAYLVDKDNGNIYFFHPSGYFDLLQ